MVFLKEPTILWANKKIVAKKLVFLLALHIGKSLHIYVRFGLGDKILAHSLTNVEMTSVHRMIFFTWM
jgi:hypothetical protein